MSVRQENLSGENRLVQGIANCTPGKQPLIVELIASEIISVLYITGGTAPHLIHQINYKFIFLYQMRTVLHIAVHGPYNNSDT